MESAVTLLPHPELADDGQRLAALERKRHPVHGLHEATARVKVGAQILNFEHAVTGGLRRRGLVGGGWQASLH